MWTAIPRTHIYNFNRFQWSLYSNICIQTMKENSYCTYCSPHQSLHQESNDIDGLIHDPKPADPLARWQFTPPSEIPTQVIAGECPFQCIGLLIMNNCCTCLYLFLSFISVGFSLQWTTWFHLVWFYKCSRTDWLYMCIRNCTTIMYHRWIFLLTVTYW